MKGAGPALAHSGHVTGSVNDRPWAPSANVHRSASQPRLECRLPRMQLVNGLFWSGILLVWPSRPQTWLPRSSVSRSSELQASMPQPSAPRPSVPPSWAPRSSAPSLPPPVRWPPSPPGPSSGRPLSPWWPPVSSGWVRCPAVHLDWPRQRCPAAAGTSAPATRSGHHGPRGSRRSNRQARCRRRPCPAGSRRSGRRGTRQSSPEVWPATPELGPVSGRQRPRSIGPPARRLPARAAAATAPSTSGSLWPRSGGPNAAW